VDSAEELRGNVGQPHRHGKPVGDSTVHVQPCTRAPALAILPPESVAEPVAGVVDHLRGKRDGPGAAGAGRHGRRTAMTPR
jgi:hypothetical protein